MRSRLPIFSLYGGSTRNKGNASILIMAMFALLTIWSFLDGSKLVIANSAKPDWLRFTRVHPAALAYLRSIAKPTSSS